MKHRSRRAFFSPWMKCSPEPQDSSLVEKAVQSAIRDNILREFMIAFDGAQVDEFVGDDGELELEGEIEGNMSKLQALYNLLANNITTSKWRGQSLNLRNNILEDTGSKIIAEALAKNKTVTRVSLAKNKIGPEGGIAIGNCLTKNTTLKSISLDGNGIGPKGGQAIADMLAENTTLKAMDLDRNNLGPAGGKAIADGLEKNTTLIKLSITSNNLDGVAVEALAQSKRNRSDLTIYGYAGFA